MEELYKYPGFHQAIGRPPKTSKSTEQRIRDLGIGQGTMVSKGDIRRARDTVRELREEKARDVRLYHKPNGVHCLRMK